MVIVKISKRQYHKLKHLQLLQVKKREEEEKEKSKTKWLKEKQEKERKEWEIFNGTYNLDTNKYYHIMMKCR